MESEDTNITLKVENDINEEDCEGIDSKSTSQPGCDGNSPNGNNNMSVSRSSSCSSLVSSTPGLNDHNGKNGSVHPDDLISNDESDADLEKQLPTRTLPNINVPEKIVLCIDISEDPDCTPFKLSDESKYPTLYMVKRAAEIFMYSKSLINNSHEFALMVLQSESVVWLKDFTNNPQDIISVLEDLNETSQGDTFDLTSMFDVIFKHVPLPRVEEPNITMPPFVVRAVLLYSRSYCIPEFTHGRDSFKTLSSSDFFTLDILYIHEDPSENNKCEEIFNVLYELDETGYSYVLDVPRNATKFHDNMAMLLAHPLQRPLQKAAHYKLPETFDGGL